MTRPAPVSEASVQSEILRAFGSHPGLRLWRSNSGAARGASGQLVWYNFKGMADISGFISPTGRALYIEVKSPTGRQTAEQRQFQTICGRFGAIYILARSVADVYAGLTAHGVHLS